MVKKDSATDQTATAEETLGPSVKVPIESKYSVKELAAAAVFHKRISPDVVVAAMKIAGLSEATPSEAEKIINNFLHKEV